MIDNALECSRTYDLFCPFLAKKEQKTLGLQIRHEAIIDGCRFLIYEWGLRELYAFFSTSSVNQTPAKGITVFLHPIILNST